MYVTLKISAQVFDAVKAAMADTRLGDYYNTAAGARSVQIPADTPAPIAAISHSPYWGQHEQLLSYGYTVTDQGACYSTSGRNVHGVYKTPEGKYLAFYWGRRSRVGDLIGTLMGAGVTAPTGLWVVEYQTEGPSDMLWHEDRAQYLARLDDLALADALAHDPIDTEAQWGRELQRDLQRQGRLDRITRLTRIERRRIELQYRRQRAMA